MVYDTAERENQHEKPPLAECIGILYSTPHARPTHVKNSQILTRRIGDNEDDDGARLNGDAAAWLLRLYYLC